jgi:hypothetical protein
MSTMEHMMFLDLIIKLGLSNKIPIVRLPNVGSAVLVIRHEEDSLIFHRSWTV